MRIILVSRHFAPDPSIGAVRPSNLAYYLSQFGHKVLCVTEDCGVEADGEWFRSIQILRVKSRKFKSQNPNSMQQKQMVSTIQPDVRNQSRTEKWARRTARQLIHVLDEFEWSQLVYKKLTETVSINDFDCVLTSFGPISSVLIGQRVKKLNPDITWVSDMRDTMYSCFLQQWRRLLYLSIEKKMVRQANMITAVSNAIGNKYKTLCKRFTGHEGLVYVIENGYEELTQAISPPPQDGILRIGYTGSMYGQQRRMDALFEAIEELDQQGGEAQSIEVHYAGPHGDNVQAQAEKANVEKHLICHGSLPKNEAYALQESCDILCVISWNTKSEQGILTGKFAEYLRLRRPILSLVSGDVPNSELTERIERSHLGFAYEYIRKDDSKRLENWLSDMFALKKSGNALEMLPESSVECYSYCNLVRKLESTIEKIGCNKQSDRQSSE
jgi:glycosyltransferase involved in cell wall biosynthesis